MTAPNSQHTGLQSPESQACKLYGSERLKTPGHVSLLFLGGAKRVSIARMFKEAAAARGLKCDITGYELDTRCALSVEGVIAPGLRWRDPHLLPHISSVVDYRAVDIIIPFVDPAVGVAADYITTGSLSPVFAPVTQGDMARMMFDKVAAAQFFEAHDIPVPATWHTGDPVGRLIAKPRFGSASKGILLIDNESELTRLLSSGADDYLIQERIDNRTEITVDCYVGTRDGVPACISPRIRLEVSGGEVVRTVTIDEPDVIELTRKVLRETGLRGAVTVQLIRDRDNKRLMVMEINPRLGGGVVASVHAGADIPGLIIDDMLGAPLMQQQPEANVYTARYLADFAYKLNESCPKK